MISGLYDSKGKAIQGPLNLPDMERYDSIVGSIDVSSKAGSPVSGGKGVLDSRVGQSTFIGTISVKDAGGTEKVRMGRLGVGDWGLTVYDGNLIGGSLDIGTGASSFHIGEDGLWAGADGFDDAPVSISPDGDLIAESGTIGGFTIENDRLYGGKISTARNVQAGAAGVIMDTAGLRGYDPVLGQVFNLPTDGSAPEFSSGVIKNTEFQLQTSAVIRTSDTVGDGTSGSAGVLINNSGLYATEANQSLEDANIKILSTGEAVINANIRGGQDDFMSGTGYFLGLSGGDYKFSIGNPDANNLNWDGEYLRIKGNLELTSPLTNMGYTTVNLPVPPTEVGYLICGGVE